MEKEIDEITRILKTLEVEEVQAIKNIIYNYYYGAQ